MLIDQLPEITDANDADEMPIEQGTTTRKIKILNLLKGVVSKAGDTMTGGLTISNYLAVQRSSGNAIAIDDLADDSTVSPSSARNNIPVAFRDKNGVALGVIRTRHTASSYKGLYLYGNNSSAPSGSQTNGLYLMVNDSGEKLVTLTDVNAWLTALGLGTPTIVNTQSSIITAGSGITIVGCKYAQLGKIGQLYLRWKSSSPITVTADGNATNVTVGTLVSGKRPAIASVGVSMGDAGGPAFYYIADDGSVSLAACGGTGSTRTIAAGTEFYCMSTYILP